MKPQEALTEPSAPTREEEQAEVIRRLEEDIIFGRFAPGSRLVEDTLMTRYGASRHFVRQALFQLERQGIVLREKNIGATVRFYSAEEVRQIYEVREMLTRQAALMIAPARPRQPDRAIERIAAAILRQGRRAGSARHPRGQRRLSRRAVFGLRQPVSGALAAGLHEPDAADARQESRRPGGAGAIPPPARIDDRAVEGPRQLGAGAALRRSHAVQQVGLSRAHRRG